MEAVITFNSDIKKSALRSLSKLCNSEELSDIKFQIHSRIYPAHKCILFARSDYFRSLLTGKFAENQNDVIELKEITLDDFELGLGLIYGTIPDSKDMDEDMVLRIMKVSSQFAIVDLEKTISNFTLRSRQCINKLSKNSEMTFEDEVKHRQNIIRFVSQHFHKSPYDKFPVLYKDKQYCDAKIKVGDTVFEVHKCILAARSDYFRATFAGNFMEKEQDIIELKEVSVDEFELCLGIIYGTIPDFDITDADMVLNFFIISQCFLIDNLTDIISNYLIKTMRSEDVLKIFSVAYTYSLPELELECIEKISRRDLPLLELDDFLDLPAPALKKFLSLNCLYLPEIEIFRGVQNWLKANPDVDSVQEILDLVRLGRMSENELMDIVLPTNLYSKDKIMDTIKHSKFHPDRLKRGLLAKNQNLCTLPESNVKVLTFSGTFPDAFKIFESEFKRLDYITLELSDCHIVNFFELHMCSLEKTSSFKINYSNATLQLEDLDKIKWKDAGARYSKSHSEKYGIRVKLIAMRIPETVVQYVRILVLQKEDEPPNIFKMQCSFVV